MDHDQSHVEGELQELRNALDVLEAAAQTPVRSRAVNISPHIDEVSEYAFQFGLPSTELERVVKLITVKSELDQTSVTTLIKNLYPTQRVGSAIICNVVGALGKGQRKPSPSSQSSLVRWLAAVHQVLEEPAFLSRLYGVLFNLLDMMSLRSQLCQLLGTITRRKHVRPFRIQKLLDYCQQYGNEPGLVGLLKVYKNFHPDTIIGIASSGRPVALSQLDIEFRKRLLSIQDATSRFAVGGVSTRSGFKVVRNVTQRVKSSTIPEVHTFHAEEAAIMLEEIDSVDTFVERLDRIDPPSQLIAGLKDALLQKYLLLRPSEDMERRFEFWLQRYFEDELDLLQEGFGMSSTLTDTLTAVVSYTEATKELHPVAERFLVAYLPQWDGSSNIGLIIDLLAALRPQKLMNLRSSIFTPLEKAILGGAHSPFDALFDFYGTLARNWIVVLSRQDQNAKYSKPQNNTRDLLSHVAILALSALASSEAATSAVLEYYERISAATLAVVSSGIAFEIFFTIPPPQTFYLLSVSPSASIISRLCGLLVKYKSIFETKRRLQQTQDRSTPILNYYIMDMCNLIWRSRAFVKNDSNAKGCLCPDPVILATQPYLLALDLEYSLASMFGLSFNPLLAEMSKTAFRVLEESKTQEAGGMAVVYAGPVTERGLLTYYNDGGTEISWRDYRVWVLDWLEQRGLHGIKALIYANIRDIK